MSQPRVDLGFVEKPNQDYLLQSNYFPSKVGGKPAWLSLRDLPKNADLQCGKCSKTLTFLCQIYCPDEENDNCFHRTIYLFVCRDLNCCQRNSNINLAVFRNQLPRNNPFYPFDPPDENNKPEWNIEKFVTICKLCGSSADKHCSKCKIVSYCCRGHQIIDWKTAHKINCGKSETCTDNKFLFEEFEIIIDEEILQEKEETEETEKRRLEEFQELESKGQLGTMQDCEDLEEHVSEIDDDKTFLKFRERIDENPGQILRYQKGGQPLWIAREPTPSHIPNCEYCGGERQFEFQILPQLLYHLKENNLDWGILCIYTCKNNCTSGETYKKEYVFKQDVALTNL